MNISVKSMVIVACILCRQKPEIQSVRFAQPQMAQATEQFQVENEMANRADSIEISMKTFKCFGHI